MPNRYRITGLAFVAVLLATPAASQTIIGKAQIVSGNVIEINRRQIRLFGIFAPLPGQTCTAKGVKWACGQNATFALSAIVERQWVHCRPVNTAPNKPITATCRLAGDNGPDIGAAMVRQGWALADRPRTAKYAGEENAARRLRRGVWVGEFIEPWNWKPKQVPPHSTTR